MARSNQRGEFKGRGQDRVRLPQPAMRQLQPMPVAPQQGGGMFSGVMNPVTRPVVGNNMPINNVNPQVGMGMPNLRNGMNQTEYRPTDDMARGPTVDQLNQSDNYRDYFNTSYNPPVTLTEPNQQPIAAEAPVNQNGVVMPTNTNAGITGINNPATNQINPVMTQVDRAERISDPNLREAYFGSPDTPGIINTAYEAAQKSFLDNPAIGKQVAGLSPLEMEAMQGAYSGIGSYQPYLDAQQSGILEGLGMSRRAGQIAQPYFAGQEQYLGGATEQARQAAGMQFDPSTMTQAYFDPFEDRVVQQTMDDVFKQGDIADVAQRARDIQSGGESAFGSRARLTADERRSSLGRGLGEALARIRSSGFQNAQSSAMGEFGRQQQARERYGDTLSQFGNQLGGIGATRSALTRGIGSDISGYGGQIGGLGSTQYGLGARQRDELAGLGSVARGVSQAGLDSDYNRRMEDRMAPVTAATYARGFLPAYQPGFTDVNKQYGMPADPLSMGLGTVFSTYGNFANRNQPQYNQPLS